MVFSHVFVDSLGIKVVFMRSNNSLPMIGQNFSFKYCIQELLLFQEKIPIFSGNGLVEGIQDFTEILSPGLITEGSVPGVVELLILQGGKQARVTLDPAAK